MTNTILFFLFFLFYFFSLGVLAWFNEQARRVEDWHFFFLVPVIILLGVSAWILYMFLSLAPAGCP